MTILELKRSMDGRLRRLGRSMDARFERLERSMRSMRSEITGSAQENGRLAEETRRHFDVVAESLRDEIRLIAEAVGSHTERLDQHEMRLNHLERRGL